MYPGRWSLGEGVFMERHFKLSKCRSGVEVVMSWGLCLVWVVVASGFVGWLHGLQHDYEVAISMPTAATAVDGHTKPVPVPQAEAIPHSDGSSHHQDTPCDSEPDPSQESDDNPCPVCHHLTVLSRTTGLILTVPQGVTTHEPSVESRRPPVQRRLAALGVIDSWGVRGPPFSCFTSQTS